MWGAAATCKNIYIYIYVSEISQRENTDLL